MSDQYESDSGPRERSTYSAFGDEYRGYDVREDDNGGKGPLVLALAAGVILVFGTVVWNAYRQGTKSVPGDAPVFAADTTPYKYRPEAVSGNTSEKSGDRLFEEGTGADLLQTSGSASSNASKVAGQPRDIRPPQIADEPETKPASPVVTPSVQPTPQPRLETPKPVVAEPPPRQETPVVTPAVTAPRELPPVEPKVLTTAFDPDGSFLVQIMALRDLGATEKAWSQLAEANSDLFAGAEMDIQRADLGAKGIFYRLRASAFSSRDKADGFCNALKARGQSCMVVAKS